MPSSDPVADRVVLEFLRRHADDARRGEEPGLAHYQALFPGHEELVAKEWAQLHEEQDARDDHTRRLGPYRLLDVVGRGGQGVVYRAIDERIGRTVALKLLPGLAPEHGLPDRVQRELEAIARLDHPGLGVVYEAGVQAGQVYLAMRYVPGRSLAELLHERSSAEARDDDRGRRDRLADDVGLVEKLAHALHAAHEAGVVHRDVKPANVMIHESGEPVLLDFGLARADDSALATITASGELLGTTAYMAPERLRGEGGTDRHVDVWALGVLLYELLTGRRPFEGPGLDEVSRRIRVEDPVDPRRLARGIPRDLAVVVGTALEKEPGRRYPTALALAEELARVRAGRPVHARPPGPLGRLRRWAWRHPALAALTLVLLIGLLGSVWGALTMADLADAERSARERSDELNVQLQLRQQELQATAERERIARREAEALLVTRGAEQAQLLKLAGNLGRRWEMLATLEAAARTRAALEPPLPEGLPSTFMLRELATEALLTVDARHDRVIHRSSLGSGRFSRDGTRLVTTWVAPDFGRAGLRVLDTASGDELIHMDGMFLLSDSFCVSLAADGRHLLVPRSDAISLWRTADVLHAQQYAIPADLDAAAGSSNWEVAFLPGERFFVGVGAPRNDPGRPHGWAIWELETARVVQHHGGAPDLHDWLALSPDDRHLLLPDGARAVSLLRLPVGADGAPVIARWEAPEPVRAATLGAGEAPDVHLLMRAPGADRDELARVDAAGRVLARRELPVRTSDECGLLRRSPDGRTLALVEAGGGLMLLDAVDLHALLRIPAPSQRSLDDLRFAANGRELLSHSGAEGGDAWELELDPGLERRLPLRPRPGSALAFSADGFHAAALVEDGRAPRLARVLPGSPDDPPVPVLQLPDDADPLEHLAVDATGARVAAAGGGALWLWELPEPGPRRLERPGDAVDRGLAFADDGALRLWQQPGQGPDRVVDVLTGERRALDAATHEHWITPDRALTRALLVPQLGARPPLRLAHGELTWMELPGGRLQPLPGVAPDAFRTVYSARFSDDGEFLAAVIYLPQEEQDGGDGLDDFELLAWDLGDDALLWRRAMDPHMGPVAPAPTRDGRWVLAPEPGGRVVLLDGRTGEALVRWRAHAAELAALHVLGDGARLVTRAADGEVKVWELAALRRQLDALGLGF